MAEAGMRSAVTEAACGACGHTVPVHEKIPATFCMDCGCSVLNLAGDGSLPPFVPPGILAEGAWAALTSCVIDGGRASLRQGRLRFVPFHEWEPDVSRRGLVRDARAILEPATDLLPAGLRPPRSPRGDGLRGLDVVEVAHMGRLADPRQALDLIRQGDVVDVMIPPSAVAPAGADPGARPRLLYYPFWFFTYAVDHRERVGVVDATNGRPVGSASPPSRWRPAILASLAGAATFGIVWWAVTMALPAPLPALVAGFSSWVAAMITLGRTISRERSR